MVAIGIAWGKNKDPP